MTTLNVVWLGGIRGVWDEGLLEHLLAGKLGPTSLKFKECDQPDATGLTIIVICGSYYAPRLDELRSALSNRGPSIIAHVADEGHLLDSHSLLKPGDIWWRQIENPWEPPFCTDKPDRALISGWRKETVDILSSMSHTTKDLLWAYSGQVNHSYRVACYEQLIKRHDGELHVSRGFGGFDGGLAYPDHLKLLARAKIAPCPSGPVTADTMRLYEALEAGCLPICNRRSPKCEGNYWLHVFGQEPFPCVDDWRELGPMLDRYAADPVRLRVDTLFALDWWWVYKRQWAGWLEEDVNKLQGVGR